MARATRTFGWIVVVGLFLGTCGAVGIGLLSRSVSRTEVEISVVQSGGTKPDARNAHQDAVRPDRRKPAGRPVGFRVATRESGIDFRMSCLPSEQGETYKANLYDHGCGVAVADVDGDGWDDVLLLNQLGGNALYRNRGDGTFENVTAQAGPVDLKDRICIGAAFGDFDNDDDQDLYVTSTRGGNVLFENDGHGHFLDVTEPAGLTCVAHSQCPAFFDYENDGDLDLYVANSGRWTSEFDPAANYYPGSSDMWSSVAVPENREYNRLYRNDGDGSFSDVTAEAGLSGVGWCGDLAVFDYDEDGRLDVLVTNMFGRSQLFHNAGDGAFDNVTAETLGRTSMGAIGSRAFDFNNDGRLDLFIADMHSDMWSTPTRKPDPLNAGKKFQFLLGPAVEDNPRLRAANAKAMAALHIDRQTVLFGNTLFRNEGGGRFTEVSDAAGMETFWPWGVATGDYDNNGYEDVYLPSGMGYPYPYWPSSLMLNNGDETFTERGADEGIEPPVDGPYFSNEVDGVLPSRSSRCAASADFDGDGRLDLMVNNFNDRPYYFRNQFPRRHYIAFRLRGTQSNHDAVGAVVKLSVGSQTMVRQVQASGGYLSQSTKTLHFGLGDQEQVEWAEVRWPSGRRQVIERPDVDQLHVVIEVDRE